MKLITDVVQMADLLLAVAPKDLAIHSLFRMEHARSRKHVQKQMTLGTICFQTSFLSVPDLLKRNNINAVIPQYPAAMESDSCPRHIL